MLPSVGLDKGFPQGMGRRIIGLREQEQKTEAGLSAAHLAMRMRELRSG